MDQALGSAAAWVRGGPKPSQAEFAVIKFGMARYQLIRRCTGLQHGDQAIDGNACSLEHRFTSQRIFVDVDDLFGLVQVPHSLRNLATGFPDIDQK